MNSVMNTMAGRPGTSAPLNLCCIAALTLAVGCSKQSTSTSSSPPLAKVGSTEIRAEDFQREVDWRLKNRRTVADKQALLDEMILQEALLQRAKAAGVDADPQLQREIRQLIIGSLLDREMAARQEAVTVTTEEARADYERNLTKYTQPAKHRLSLLYLEAGPKMSEPRRAEVKSRLQEARRQAAERPAFGGRGPAGQGFGALALENSDDQASRYRGGDIGWFDDGAGSARWPKSVLAAGAALEKGQMSEVLEAEDGLYLILKTDQRERSVTPFAQAEAALRQGLLARKRQEIEKAYRQEAVARAGTSINTQALAAVDLPAAAVTRETGGEPPSAPGVNLSSRRQ